MNVCTRTDCEYNPSVHCKLYNTRNVHSLSGECLHWEVAFNCDHSRKYARRATDRGVGRLKKWGVNIIFLNIFQDFVQPFRHEMLF